MKGVINKGIQELVEAKFGVEAWEKIKEMAGCDEPFFAISEDYPDELTIALIQAAAQVSGLPEETVMVEFGKFWVPNTGKNSYPTFFKLAGKNSREFLLNMDRVHAQTTKSVANSLPPRFEYDETEDGGLIMHYNSHRGLCKVFRGLILGVGIHFDEELAVKETACALNGDPRCTMEIHFP